MRNSEGKKSDKYGVRLPWYHYSKPKDWGPPVPVKPSDFYRPVFYQNFKALQDITNEIEQYADSKTIEGKTYIKICETFHKHLHHVFNSKVADFNVPAGYVSANLCRSTYLHYDVRWGCELTLGDLCYLQPDQYIYHVKKMRKFMDLPCDVIKELCDGWDPRLVGCYLCMGKHFLKLT